MIIRKRKIVVFVKNKLITLDTVIPLLLELKVKHNISSEIVVFDSLAHEAINNNVVLSDLVTYVGKELFITKGENRKFLRRIYVLSSLVRLIFGFFMGDKIIHFGILNDWKFKFVSLLFNTNIYQMQGTAFDFNYPVVLAIFRDLTLPTYTGKNIIICTEDVKRTDFRNCANKNKIYKFIEPRTRISWVEYINSKSDYYFNKYHDSIDTSNGVIVFILATIDLLEYKKRLFHSTINILSNSGISIPILLKPHAYTEMDTVYKAIKGNDLFHVTYLHPSVLATKSRVFISNNFSNTFADAHSFGVTTVEYTDHPQELLEVIGEKPENELFVDYFINNDSAQFAKVMNDIMGEKYDNPLFKGHYRDDNALDILAGVL